MNDRSFKRMGPGNAHIWRVPAATNAVRHARSRMHALRTPLLLFFQLAVLCSWAQGTVDGRVRDKKDQSSLPGASVLLLLADDTTQRRSAVADPDGLFRIDNVTEGKYILRVAYTGYATVQRNVDIPGSTTGLVVDLEISVVTLKEVEASAVMKRVEQKGDTTIFNANAFKVHPDATAEDLVTKMPGIVNDNGTIKAQGEAVKRVLVDGEEFFGDDANIALKNLPAEVIDKVQVFDKPSDQAQFTGFDTGDPEKTLNIVTKAGRNKGLFGRSMAGYGTDERYLASLSLNRFKGPQRITLLVQSNNINQQNFSSQDLVGLSSGGGRGGMRGASGFLTGTQPGINTTNSVGLNYSDKFSKSTKLSGSWFYNNQNSVNNSASDRTTYLSDSTEQRTVQHSDRGSVNHNHRASFRFEHALDSLNSFVFAPRVGFQRNTTRSNSGSSVTDDDASALSSSSTESDSQRDGIDLSSDLLFRHRTRVKGRTFSVRALNSFTSQSGRSTLDAHNTFHLDTSAVVLRQRSSTTSRAQRHSLELNWTEPVGENGQLQFTMEPRIQLSNSEKLTFDVDGDQQAQAMDTLLSNKADNGTRTLKSGLSYRIKLGQWKLTSGLDAQGTWMTSQQTFPHPYEVHRDYVNLLPNATISWRDPRGTRVRFSYWTSTSTPSISQLQTVVDNSDPLKLSTGNLALGQGYSHMLRVQFNKLDSAKTHPLFVMLNLTTQQDRISNVTYAPRTDSVLADGSLLRAGAQLSLPGNLDGYLSARGLINYGLPWLDIGSNVNVNAGGSWERLPGAVNGTRSFNTNTNLNVGAVITTNIAQGIDARLGYTANHNTARSELRPSSNNSYYQGQLTARITLNGTIGWLVESEVNYNQYVGLGAGFDQDVLVWNGALGWKFLKNDAMEAKITCFDILGRNASVSRTVGDTYVENAVTSMLRRYLLFTLGFNLRAFKGVPEDDGPDDGPGMHRPPPGGRPPGDGPPR